VVLLLLLLTTVTRCIIVMLVFLCKIAGDHNLYHFLWVHGINLRELTPPGVQTRVQVQSTTQ